MKHWLVDTQLIADWCLWQLADERHRKRRIERAATALSVLPDRAVLRAFERELGRSRVLVPTNVLVEVSGVVRRVLGNAHKGTLDRLNELVVRVSLRFADRFKIEVVGVTEDEADTALSILNSRNPPKPFDLGDAALLAALTSSKGRSLLTADIRLRDHCVSAGRIDVFRFAQGKILDAAGLQLRDEHPGPAG
jgi:predicted nucleic acid-binding protein